jgi:hypothetical protein
MLTFDHSLYIAWRRFAGVSNERELRAGCNGAGDRHTTSSILGRSFVVDSSTPKIETIVREGIIGETVRRERRCDSSGCNSRPGTGSLHPVAIEAIAEATKLSELSMERVARRLRERAGRNVSER